MKPFPAKAPHALCLALCLAALISLGGCMSILHSSAPPATTYALHAGPGHAQSQARGVMAVEEPALPAGFETDQIALFLDGGRRLDYYAGARWAAPLDHVLHDVVVASGRGALPKMIVDTPDLNIPTDYRLSVRIDKFAPVYAGAADAPPVLKVAATFTLVRIPQQTVIADFTVERAQPAASNNLGAIAAGMEGLLHGALDEAFGRIAAALPKAPKK
jgi:ABC-type uncharacterized transport system auxiliary subunit